MKWWYFKRFLVPAVTSRYQSLLLMDSDIASAPEFPIRRFLHIANAQRFALCQPAVRPEGRSTDHPFLHPRRGMSARWTNYVECGPMNLWTGHAWAEYWPWLEYNRSIGWGVDFVWCVGLGRRLGPGQRAGMHWHGAGRGGGTSSMRQLLGAQTAHPATFSTAPAHRPLGSANAETTPARAPAAAADRMQRPDATCEGKNG